MRIRSSRTIEGPSRYKLSLIALIDVVLFLLLYFMIAGTLAPEEKELPSTLRADRGSGSRQEDLQPQIITVALGANAMAEYRLGARVVNDKDELSNILRALPKEGGVFVRTSGKVRVDAAAAALQACRDAGFVRITYVPSN